MKFLSIEEVVAAIGPSLSDRVGYAWRDDSIKPTPVYIEYVFNGTDIAFMATGVVDCISHNISHAVLCAESNFTIITTGGHIKTNNTIHLYTWNKNISTAVWRAFAIKIEVG